MTYEERAEACMKEVKDVLDKWAMVFAFGEDEDDGTLMVYLEPREEIQAKEELH